jgi:hypothetical protein
MYKYIHGTYTSKEGQEAFLMSSEQLCPPPSFFLLAKILKTSIKATLREIFYTRVGREVSITTVLAFMWIEGGGGWSQF